MFERYNEKARRAIFFARYEASNSGSSTIEAGHLLLGAVREGGLGPTILDAMRTEIEKVSPPGAPLPASMDLPVSDAFKRAMAHASEEADKLGHRYIGVEHLLLGLMADDPESLVPALLRKHGIDRARALSGIPDQPSGKPVDRDSLKALVDNLPPERVQDVKQLLESLGPGDELQFEFTPAGPRKMSTSPNLARSVKRAMAFAAEEAERLGHKEIGVAHLLLGLMRDEPGAAIPKLLREQGIDREKVLGAIAGAPAEAPVDRDGLKALVDSLPEERLRGAKQLLEHMQILRPRPLPPPPFGVEGSGFGGGRGFFAGMFRGPGTWGASGPMPQGRRSRSWMEDGVEVVETYHSREGCEIRLIERFRLSEDGKTLSYTQEITGPGKTEQHTIDFEVG